LGGLLNLTGNKKTTEGKKTPELTVTPEQQKKKTDLKTNIPPILREFEKELKR